MDRDIDVTTSVLLESLESEIDEVYRYPEGDDFCKIMHANTKEVHDESDKIVKSRLAIVLTDKRSYAAVLTDFYFIYKTIENYYDKYSEHQHLKGMLPNFLRRTKHIEEDLQFYLGDNWREVAIPSKVAEDYMLHLDKLMSEDPALLMAYIHSMYLALLAGGVMIRKLIKRTLGLGGECGLSLFSFDFSGATSGRITPPAAVDTPPAEEGETPPVADVDTPPAEEGETPPVADVDTPPAEGTEPPAVNDAPSVPTTGGRSFAKQALKSRINALARGLSPDVRQRILAEKRKCYAMNNRVAVNSALSDWSAYARIVGLFGKGALVVGVMAFAVGYTISKVLRSRSN